MGPVLRRQNLSQLRVMKQCAFVFSRVWDVNTGEVLNTLIHHNEAVLHLRFSNGLMVTCSKDRSIAVWDMASATDITLRRVLVGHRAAVNVVDFDDKYIVSASGDRTIKVSVPAVITLPISDLYTSEREREQRGLMPAWYLASSLFSSVCAHEPLRPSLSCVSGVTDKSEEKPWPE